MTLVLRQRASASQESRLIADPARREGTGFFTASKTGCKRISHTSKNRYLFRCLKRVQLWTGPDNPLSKCRSKTCFVIPLTFYSWNFDKALSASRHTNPRPNEAFPALGVSRENHLHLTISFVSTIFWSASTTPSPLEERRSKRDPFLFSVTL